MPDRPVLVLTGRHRPHEILLLAVSLLLGVAYTVGAPPPASVTALLPAWAVHVWAAGMGVSGALGLAAVAVRWSRALQVEQAAMLIGAAALIWYTVAVLPLGWRSLLAVAISVAWTSANMWRATQIHRDLKSLR